MIKDLIKYALLAIALLVVTMLVTYAFAHVFHLDKTNRNAVDDWLYLLLLIPVFHKLRYIDLQDAISVNRFSWGVFLVAFICLSTMSYAIDMGASLLHTHVTIAKMVIMDGYHLLCIGVFGITLLFRHDYQCPVCWSSFRMVIL